MPRSASPSLISETVSTAIVENVVNAPRNPIEKNSLGIAARREPFDSTVRNSPSTNAPLRLVTNVAHGKVSFATWIQREIP